VRTESELAIAEHWGVGLTTVWSWRKALGVGRMTEGTRELYREMMPRKLTPERVARGRRTARMPEAIEKIRRSKTGKPMHPRTRESLLSAARRPKSEGWRRANSERMRRQWADGTRTAGKDLTPPQRQALDLRQQGLSIKEIAARMGRQPENVRQLVARARTKLARASRD
jgi:RNA polymerase sigma factor (sigma-70 family)